MASESNNNAQSATEALTQAVSKLSDILATAAATDGQKKYLDYDGLAELVSKLGQTYATLAALADYAKTGDIPTLSSLGGVGSVSASGTSPLSLSASKSGTAVSISGSVDLSDYAKTGDLKDYAKSSDIPTLSGLGGVGSVSASGTSPLTLSASKSGTAVTITGSMAASSASANGYMSSTQASDLSTLVSGAVTSASASGTSPLTLNASKSGNSLAITGSVDLSGYAKDSDIPTLSGLGGVGSVSASGTSPLTLSASKSGTAVTITGSVANASTSANGLMTSTQVSNLDTLVSGAVTSATASGTSPLTLNASKSGNSLAISGSVDLSDYAKTSALPTLSSLSGVGTVNASGTSPLSLSASKSGTTVTLSGSVANATASTAGVVKPYSVLTSAPTVNSVTTTSGKYYGVSTNPSNQLVVNVPWTDTTSSLSDLGGVGSVSASGTSPLSLSASKSGTAVTITGSVSTASTSANGLMTSTQVSNLNTLVSGAVTSVSASGTSPLSLSGSISSNKLTLSGSVADANASTAGVVKPYSVLSNAPVVNSITSTSGKYYGVSTDSGNHLVVNVPWTDTTSSLSDLGGVGSVSASGTSPLSLSASKSGTSVAISGSVDLSNYATKDEVVTMGRNQCNSFGVTVDTSDANCTAALYWLYYPDTITTGEESEMFGVYFSNINGKRIVGRRTADVGNLTIGDLGGLAAGDLKTVAGESLVGSGDVDPTPWAVKLDGNSDIPGANTITMSTSSYSGIDYDGLAFYNGRVCPYVINSSNNATVYTNWISQTALKYNDSTGANASARKDLVFIYDDAAYVYNGYYLGGIGENIDADQADLNYMRSRYPSATLLDNLDLWFDISAGEIETAYWRYAKIMDYDPDSGTCRIRFGVYDSEEQKYVVGILSGGNFVAESIVSSSGDRYRAYFDIIVPYDGSDFVKLQYKYIVTY